MKNPVLLAILIWAGGAASLTGQTMPFRVLATFDQAAKEAAKNGRLDCVVRSEHTDPADRRPVVLTLKTPDTIEELVINPDGTIVVPPVPEADWDKSTVTHNLEKGAMTLGFNLKLADTLKPEGGNLDAIFRAMGETFAADFATLDKLTALAPDMKGTACAVTGVRIVSDGEGPGEVLLMSMGKKVDSIDLSKKGEVTWLFEQYDPVTHSLEMRAEGDKVSLKPVQMVGPPARLPKNAIVLYQLK